MISNRIWRSILQFLDKNELNEQIRTTIVHIMINIFMSKKSLADEINCKLQQLLIDNNQLSKKFLLALLNGFYVIITTNSSVLHEKTLLKLQDLLTNEDNLIVERTHAILDYLDDKRTLSNSVRYSFNAQVKSELTATQNTSVSQSEEDCIEPTAKFLGLDNLLGKTSQRNQSVTSNVEPTAVQTGHNQALYRTTYYEIQNLQALAKTGSLKDQDFTYLLTKLKDDGWHFSAACREVIYQMIIGAFRDAAKATQKIPSDIIDCVVHRLYTTTEELVKTKKFLDAIDSLSNIVPTRLQMYIAHITVSSSVSYTTIQLTHMYLQVLLTLAQTCSECLLIIVRDQESLNENQINTIEQTIKLIKDTQVKKDLIEIYKLCLGKGHRLNIDLSSIENELNDSSTSTAVSYFFFQVAALQNQVFSEHQMSRLCSVAKSPDHTSEARENCLWAMAYSIKTMPTDQWIAEATIDDIGELVQSNIDTIRNAAIVALCYYVNESNRTLSLQVLEQLSKILTENDPDLINNILSIYLKMTKQKQQIPPIALKSMSDFLENDNQQFELREKSIWILKYAVDNGQNFESIVLNAIDHCLNDNDYSLRNTAADVFIQYWTRQIQRNNLDNIEQIVSTRMEHILLFFRNHFDSNIQKSALDLLKVFVENNGKLSGSLLDLVEYCLYDHDTFNATTAIMVIGSYSKRNLLRKQTITCLEYLLTIDTVIQSNVIEILKRILCQQEHILADRSINFLGQLLVKSIDPENILILLKHADRYQPLPKTIANLVEQNYFIEILCQSNCSTSLDKAYQRLLSLTDHGIQLTNYVVNSIVYLVKSQTRLLNIIVNITSNGQHLDNKQIAILSEIDLQSNVLLLIQIFTNLIRQNHELPEKIIDSFEEFIDNSSVQIYIIEIYQLLIERHKKVDRSIIDKILNLLNLNNDRIKKTIDFNCRLASFFKAVAENQPNDIDQIHFRILFQHQQSLSIRKDACLAAHALAKHHIILNLDTLALMIYLLNNDENIHIQNVLLETLQLAHSNHQIMDKQILQLLDLIHDQDIDTNEEQLLIKLKHAIQSGLKLYDKHLIKLSHMLFSCDLNLKRDAATILALMAANGHVPSKTILQATYATLLDETINQDTIQLLRKSPLNLPSSVIDDLLYLVLFSSQSSVKQIAQQILDHHGTDSRVMNFRLMLTMNKLTTILDENDSLLDMINSKYNHKVRTALQIVQNMIITQKRVPIDILLGVTTRIVSHTDTVLDMLIVALEKDVEFDQSVCQAIEDAISVCCSSSKRTKLLRLLTEKQFIFQTKTLAFLFDNFDDDAFKALEYASKYQALPDYVLLYFISELSDELNDIEIIRRSFNIIRQQITKSFVSNPKELLEAIHLPNGIDYHRLSQIESIEQRLGTILILLSIDYIDLNTFDLPCEQWSREFLCTDLLGQCFDKTPLSIMNFYHQLTLLEQYKKYELYNDNRDTILQELIRKRQTFRLTLSTINQVLVYLKTTSDKSIDILRSNDSDWMINMRRYFLEDKLKVYISNQHYSQQIIDHLVNQLTQLDVISVELIEPFLRIFNEPIQILSILEMIEKYQLTTDELNQLFARDENTINQKAFLRQIELTILNKVLLSKWSHPRNKLLRIRHHLETMLNHSWTFAKVHHLLTEIKFNDDDDDEASENLNQFLECLNLVIDYKIDESIEEEFRQIFPTVERKYWMEQVHQLVINRRFHSISSEKNLQMLLNEIQSNNQRDLSEQINILIKQIDQAFDLDSSISKQGQPINKWTASNIKKWAEDLYSNRNQHDFVKILPEMIAVLKQAIYLESTRYYPRLIQIISILIILDPTHVNGRLLQILTGEGKSSIVSMLVVIKALQGKQIDIVTSSMTLAKRDAHGRENFYSMFNLTVAHNNDEKTYIQGEKECYKKPIVYGTSSQFQFDILRHEFSLLNTRANRCFDVVIIDEVDSMLIDENNTLARLADHLPGMEWLNSFLCGIWQCVNGIGENLYENKYAIIKKFLTHLNDPQFEIQIPKHLHDFVQESIPLWIEHAIRAKIEYKLDHHYMIKSDETRTRRIAPVDFSNTGVVQCNTTWSDGLHQFLQMKHGLKLTPLTVTTNYLSNTGYFTRYGKEIYGLTGTIGSADAKDLLNKIYQVDTIIIPPFKQKRHFQLETILALDDNEWLKSILSTTISHATNKQAVLIICETRLDAKVIVKELQRNYRTGNVRLYADNTDIIEANIVSNEIQHGEIIVATNLAGRGTDLKTSKQVEDNGGLHVCLTFLPNNLRVEEQAIGRTSRQGQRGTSQMIISKNRTLLQLMSCYPDYLKRCNETTEFSIQTMRHWREEAERAQIERIWNEEIPEIRKKDELFSTFCQLLTDLRTQIDDSYRLLSVKEQWGLWLKSIDQMNQNRQTLERMADELAFLCIDVARDGNSFLNCLRQHFSKENFDTEKIKKTIIKHIHANKTLYEKLDETDRYWATCRALNMNLVILRHDYGPEIYKRKDATSTCFLGYEVGLQYVTLDTSKIDPTFKQSLLDNVEDDATEIQLQILNLPNIFQQDKRFESLFSTKTSSFEVKDNFKIFADEMKKKYTTDAIFQNPCYPLLEANDIIEKLSSWGNWGRSWANSVGLMDKAKTPDDAVKRLQQAIDLDSTFAFSALVNRAHFIVDQKKSDVNYKIQAKSYLEKAQEQLEKFIMPQLYMMLIKPNAAQNTEENDPNKEPVSGDQNKELDSGDQNKEPVSSDQNKELDSGNQNKEPVSSDQNKKPVSNNQNKELVFDDFNKQIETKIDILQHYHNYIKQAIQIIECSQKLIDVKSKHGDIVSMGGKLYRQDVNKFIEKHPHTIDLTFHNLTVTEDMFIKTDQALQLLSLLSNEYNRISINYFDTKLETIGKIMSQANLSTVCLTVQYLDKDQVKTIIGEDSVTLTLLTSIEQHKSAIKLYKGSIVIVETSSQRQYLSTNEALNYLEKENSIQSITFELLNQTTVNEIISNLEQVAITLTFPHLSQERMNEISQTAKKPFSIQLQNLSQLTAKNCINATDERNFTISLCQLNITDANFILNQFKRNEQDVNSSFKLMANEYAKKDQANEELSAYRNLGIVQFICIQELNPRPWISICVTAGLGAAQIIAGVCLAAATCGLGVQLGIGLITEGISDIYYAVKGAISRNFSWKDYAIQKAISLTLCFVTLGCSAISQGAKAAQATSKGTMEFLKNTLKGAGNLIKNSARTYATGAITGTAVKTSFSLAIKQVGIVCLETGARELANYAMDSVCPDLLLPLKSSIHDEIQSKTNIERGKQYFDRVLCRALIADISAGNDNWLQKLDETVVKILTKENSAFISIASSLASGISNAAVRHAKSFTGGGNSYINWASRLLTFLPAVNGSYEILKITEIFFDKFEKELTQLESHIPTFEYFIQKLDPSISQQIATEIRERLEKNKIINANGTVNIQMTLREDPSIKNSHDKLVHSLKNIQFTDEKYRDLTIKVLTEYQTMDPRSLKANKVEKRIVDMLTDQIIAIIHGTLVAPLANYVAGSAINLLSEKIQLKLDSNGTVQEQLMQEGAQRYISNLSNDFVEDVRSGKIKIPSDMEEKLKAFLEKTQDPNFKPENPTEELANAIANGKQGGVIEIAIIAALTGKSINIIQSEQGDQSNLKDADMTVTYTAPQVDKDGNIQDGHYESTDGNAESNGADDCLYASTIGKTSNTFKDTQDMRMKCAAFVLLNSEYITGIQPAISILGGCSNPIRRRQLLMEGGRQPMTVEERNRLMVEHRRQVEAKEKEWKEKIPDEIESAKNESK